MAGQRAFAFRGDKIFNFLPKFIRDTESLSGLKGEFLRIFLIHNVILILKYKLFFLYIIYIFICK